MQCEVAGRCCGAERTRLEDTVVQREAVGRCCSVERSNWKLMQCSVKRLKANAAQREAAGRCNNIEETECSHSWDAGIFYRVLWKRAVSRGQCHLDKDDITIRISFIRCLPNI